MEEQLQELQNKITELENKVDDFTNPNTISEELSANLVTAGFLRMIGPNVLTYINPSGLEFWSGLVQLKDTTTLVSLDNYRDTTGVFRKRYVEITADASSDVVTSENHGLSDTQDVWLYTTGNPPGGLDSSTIYFVRDATTDTFKLALTSGGAAINITSDGGPFNYVSPI